MRTYGLPCLNAGPVTALSTVGTTSTLRREPSASAICNLGVVVPPTNHLARVVEEQIAGRQDGESSQPQSCRIQSVGFERVVAGQQATDVESAFLGFSPSTTDRLVGSLFTGNRAKAVLSVKAVAFFAENKVMLQQVGVVLHLGDAVQLANDALLGELHDLRK